MSAVPKFPVHIPPEDWDDLTLMAGNIFAEAESEPPEGKLAVGWCVMWRVQRRGQTIRGVILQPWQFSWLNTNERAKHMVRLGNAGGPVLEASWRAAAGAMWRLLPDPTEGSDHYLNIEATKRIRGGSLPSWYREDRVTCRIGQHTFLRLEAR